MRFVLLGVTLTAMLVSPAFAHPDPGHADSLASGALHPLTGIDHVFVMVSVGLWGALVGGRAIWAWPATFVAAMLAGFVAARVGLQISFVESAISASIIVLGLLAALHVKAPLALGAATVGFFAFFHGHAHGTEVAASVIPYAVGFTLSTAVLHGAGVCMRRLLQGMTRVEALR